MPASRACVRELRLLREADAVGRGLDAEVADLARVADRVEEDRRDGRLAARELHRHLPPRLDAHRVVQQLLDVVQRQLVDVADLVGVHEARVAHHVAAVGQVDGQHRAAAVLDRRRAVVVEAVGDGVEVAAGEQVLEALEERRVDRQRVGEGAVRAGRSSRSTTLPSRSRMCALISPTCSLTSDLDRLLAATGSGRASRGRRSGRASRSCAASRAAAWCARCSS